MSITESFAQETIRSFEMCDEGQRLYDAAYAEAQADDGACRENAPSCSVGEGLLRQWQYRMDAAEMMQRAADDMTTNVGMRARAAGVDITDMLYLVDQHFYGPALAA
jgi:hypothetical protein